MTTPLHGTDRLISVRLGGQVEPRGKVIWRDRWLYFRDYPARQVWRFCDGYGVDAALLAALLADGVTEAHYRLENGTLLTTPLSTFQAKGIRRAYNGRPQLILPRGYWQTGVLDYDLPHIPASRMQVVDLEGAA